MSQDKGPLLLLVAALLACNGSSSKPAEEPSQPEPVRTRAPAPLATTEYDPTGHGTPATAAPVDTRDAPEISRSAGTPGGVVVLWPRIVLPRSAAGPDAETRAIAARVQARLADVAKRVLGGKGVDVRPEPERVCPKQGCAAMSLGILLAQAGGGCSVFALVSSKGTSPARIVPWSPGTVTLSASSVPFREPAEKHVKVQDYAPCSKLPDDLATKDADIEAAIRAAAGP